MNIPEELQSVTRNFDFDAVQRAVQSNSDISIEDQLEVYLEVILRDGYLIVQQNDSTRRQKRDVFSTRLAKYFDSVGLDHSWRQSVRIREGQALTENLYREILNSLSTHIKGRLSPDEFIWAVIRNSESGLQEMMIDVQSQVKERREMVDPVTALFRIGESVGNPDILIDETQQSLAATLKMLAYEHRWFDSKGAVTIPSAPKTTAQQREIASWNDYFAAAWRLVEKADRSVRYFGGSVTESKIPVANAEGKTKEVVATCFSGGLGDQIPIAIANERLRRVAFSHFVYAQSNPPEITRSRPTPLPPKGTFISEDEAIAYLCLNDVFCDGIINIDKEFGGLKLIEWVRGFATLKIFSMNLVSNLKTQDFSIQFAEKKLIDSLIDCGIAEAKAHTFLNHICFAKKSADILNAPLVRIADGNICLICMPAALLDITFVVLSKLAELRLNLGDFKGIPFEQKTLAYLKSKALDAAEIHRKSENLQIDMVLVWEDVLFVFENKNYSLPNGEPRTRYWFWREQVSAAKQLLKKVDAIEANPNIVSDALGKSATWNRVVPVVLNQAPFAMAGEQNGVFFYDNSALIRFFDQGQVSISVLDHSGVSSPIPKSTTKLWEGDAPMPSDLIKQLESPVQLANLNDPYYVSERVLEVSTGKYFKYEVLDRNETSLDPKPMES